MIAIIGQILAAAFILCGCISFIFRIVWWYWYNCTDEGQYEKMIDVLKSVKRTYPVYNAVTTIVLGVAIYTLLVPS